MLLSLSSSEVYTKMLSLSLSLSKSFRSGWEDDGGKRISGVAGGVFKVPLPVFPPLSCDLFNSSSGENAGNSG